MTFTPVKREQWDRSAAGHGAAESQFYPLMWPGAALTFTDLTRTYADTSLGIDYMVECQPGGWAEPIKFWIQERWRDPAFYWQYRDVTITSWNRRSDTPAEFYHFGAGIFVYGYYDPERDKVLAAFAYSSHMIYLISTGQLAKHALPPNDRNQEAFGIDRRDLFRTGCLLRQFKSRELDGTFPGIVKAAAAPVPLSAYQGDRTS